jgi:hypothetical protein
MVAGPGSLTLARSKSLGGCKYSYPVLSFKLRTIWPYPHPNMRKGPKWPLILQPEIVIFARSEAARDAVDRPAGQGGHR